MAIELAGDPSDQYVSCGSGSTIDDIFAAGGTVALWVKPDDFGTLGIAGLAVKGDGNDGWTFFFNTTGVLFFEKNGTANGNWGTGNVVPLSVWSHVALTYSSAADANDPEFYLNGVAQSLSTDTNGSGYDSDAAFNFRWGDWQVDVNARFFDGQMEDMRAYKRILTPEEILALSAGYRGPLGSEAVWLSGNDFLAVAHPDGATLTATTNNLTDLSGNGNDGVPTNSPIARASDSPRFGPWAWGLDYGLTGIAQAVAGAISFSGTVLKQTGKLVAGAQTFTGVVNKAINLARGFAGAISFAGAVVRQTNKVVAGAISFAGALARQTSTVVAGAITFVGAVVTVLGRLTLFFADAKRLFVGTDQDSTLSAPEHTRRHKG